MFGDRYDKVDLRNNIYILFFRRIRINFNICFSNFICKTRIVKMCNKLCKYLSYCSNYLLDFGEFTNFV